MDLGEVEWGGEDWIGMVQDRDKWRAHVNSVLKFHNWWPLVVLSSIELIICLVIFHSAEDVI
jgi:hypothetical protein